MPEWPNPPVQQPGQPPPNQPEPCVVRVPVPAGTVNLLDPEVIAKMVERGEAENAAEGK